MRYKYIFSHHLSHVPGDGVVWLPVALVPPLSPGPPAPPAHPLAARTGELPLTAGVDLGAAAHAAALNIDAAALVSRLANTSLSSDVRVTPGHLAACSCDSVSAALQHLSAALRVLLAAAAGVARPDTGPTPTQSPAPGHHMKIIMT